MENFNAQFNSVFVPQFSEQLVKDVQTVWQAIAADAAEFCEDNESAIEMCIDANRLAIFANEMSDVEIKRLSKEFGYQTVLRQLSKSLTIFKE